MPYRPYKWAISTYSIPDPALAQDGCRLTEQSFRPSLSHHLPLDLLSRQDPVLDRILYYEDVPLFEDELHDNGESILNARIVSTGSLVAHACCASVSGILRRDSESCLTRFLSFIAFSYGSTMCCSGCTTYGYIINSELTR